MSRFAYYFCAGIALALGLGLAVCGVGFILAGADDAHPLRPLIGVGCGVAGVAGVVAGVRMALRPLRSPPPELLAMRIVRLAGTFGGELTMERITTGLRVSEDHARAALERLIADEVCVHERRATEDWYVFPGMARR
ncbi:MAG: hypothetical protein PVH68_04530 [Armatimonadota bacterium]|jgi:xanthosine utilization system XapX-like protein